MRKKRDGRKKPLKTTVQEYAGSSTAHGIAYIFESNRLGLERLFWILFVGIAITISVCSTIKAYKEWKANPTITTINSTAYPIKNIEFPAITICSQGTSKDVMDTVILKQFEEYLDSRGIKVKTEAGTNEKKSSVRRKRSIEQRIMNSLPKEEFVKYFGEFLRDTYPGAKGSPVRMVKMMATPEIKPDVALKASALVSTKRTSCKEKKAAERKGDNTDSESPGAEGTTDSNPGLYEFLHQGHCAKGWEAPNSDQAKLEDCRNECAQRSNIGYFAYSTAISLDNCACFLADDGCPDDDKANDHNAYRIVREDCINSKGKACEGCLSKKGNCNTKTYGQCRVCGAKWCGATPGTTLNYYRVSNNGYTSWRPSVAEITVFSDQTCTNKIEVTYLDESGHSGQQDGSHAFDDDSETIWRPQCTTCNANDAWVSFSTTAKAICVHASNLGQGEGGPEPKTWNGGILVELQNSDNSWTTVIESDSGNSAVVAEANGYSLLGDGVCGGNNGYTSKDNFEACMELCKKTSECTAISWATSTNHCGLHEEAAPSAPLVDSWTEPYKCYLKGTGAENARKKRNTGNQNSCDVKYEVYISQKKETCEYPTDLGSTNGQPVEKCEEMCDKSEACRFYFYTTNKWCGLYSACKQFRVPNVAGSTFKKLSVPACNPNPCNNGGTCADANDDGTPECCCAEGFIGDTCDIPKACNPNPCNNGGTCADANDDGTPECSCAEGFIGDTCDIPKATTKEDLACILEGIEPADDSKAESPAADDSPTRRKKKKRSVSDTKPRPRREANVTEITQIKYGCPVGFERVTEYLCLHYWKNSTGNGVSSTFDVSQKYCKDQFMGASLLYFMTTLEALKIWEWLEPSQPRVVEEDYNLLRASTGMKVWIDKDEKFTSLPSFLKGAYFFQSTFEGNKSWTLNVYGPSAIYIATNDQVHLPVERTEDDVEKNRKNSRITRSLTSGVPDENGGLDLPLDTVDPDEESGGEEIIDNGASHNGGDNRNVGWRKLSGWVNTSSLALNEILVKNVHNKGINTIKLPNLYNESFVVSIFITGLIKGPVHTVDNEKVNFYRWNEKDNDTRNDGCSNTNDPQEGANYFCRSLHGKDYKAISYKKGTYMESGDKGFLIHMGDGCEKGEGKYIRHTHCSKDPSSHKNQECKLQECNNDECRKKMNKGLYDIICSLDGPTKFDEPIWLNAEWDQANRSFVYLQQDTELDASANVFDRNYMKTELVNGKTYARANVYGRYERIGLFGLKGESDKPFESKYAMTVCRSSPFVTKGIKTLNTLLDPSKSADREKKVVEAQDKYHDDFGKMDLAKSYKKLFELLWYSRLPCFDVMGVTSNEKDEMSVIKRCYWRGQMVDCASIFVTRSTDRGMCCTFNVANAEKIYNETMYRNIVSDLQKRDKKGSFGQVSNGNYDYGNEPEIHAGRSEGLQLVLDAHADKVSSGSIADNFRGFHVVIDGKDKYPFTLRNGFLLQSGQENEVIVTATRFEAKEEIKSVPPSKRNCFFPNEYHLRLHKLYSQANCFFQCKIDHVRKQMYQENETQGRCIPWFYPVEDTHLHELCDPWRTARFQTLLKDVSDDDGDCKNCLPDCASTKYRSRISSAPFKSCDRTNTGASPLCNISLGSDMMMNPPIWKSSVQAEYEKFNGGDPPEFFTKEQSIMSNIRRYAPDEDVKDLIFRAEREKKLTYNALEEDITIVSFYFDESEVIQFATFLRMSTMDFLSSVGGILGLFMGISVTTVVELIYWATVRFYRNT